MIEPILAGAELDKSIDKYPHRVYNFSSVDYSGKS
jgi:hypothetical protein